MRRLGGFTLMTLLLLGSPAIADKIRIGVYAGLEKDICPEGYQAEQRCSKLDGAKFDALLQKRRLVLIRPWQEVSLSPASPDEKKVSIRLGQELGRVRGYRRLHDLDSASMQAAIVVVVFEDESTRKNALDSDVTGSISAFATFVGEQPRSRKPPKIKIPANQRVFDHAGLAKLDPEEHFAWRFRHGKERLLIEFE
jgi:hypothetical protein